MSISNDSQMQQYILPMCLGFLVVPSLVFGSLAPGSADARKQFAESVANLVCRQTKSGLQDGQIYIVADNSMLITTWAGEEYIVRNNQATLAAVSGNVRKLAEIEVGKNKGSVTEITAKGKIWAVKTPGDDIRTFDMDAPVCRDGRTSGRVNVTYFFIPQIYLTNG